MIWKILLILLGILIIATFIICRFFFRFAVVADNGKWDQPPAKEPDPETPKGRAYYERKRKKQEAEEIPYEDAWIGREHAAEKIAMEEGNIAHDNAECQ